MSITYSFYCVNKKIVREIHEGDRISVSFLKNKKYYYDETDTLNIWLYKYGDLAFEIAHELGDVYGLKPLVYFTHRDRIDVKGSTHESYFSPEKVKEFAPAFEKVTPEMYEDAMLNAIDDLTKYESFLEDNGSFFYRDYFSPMMDFFIQAAQKGYGVHYVFG